MTVRLGLLLAVAVLLTACVQAAFAPAASTVAPSPASRTASPSVSPTDALSASPAPSNEAELSITGHGTLNCADAFYGGCAAALLLQREEAGPLPTPREWPPQMEFATD